MVWACGTRMRCQLGQVHTLGTLGPFEWVSWKVKHVFGSHLTICTCFQNTFSFCKEYISAPARSKAPLYLYELRLESTNDDRQDSRCQ